jgi:hypothetical protein
MTSGPWRRELVTNPMHPWEWLAEYRDGGQLRQFDSDGFHRSSEIDPRKLVALVLLGHPASPIRWPVPDSLRTGPIQRVVVEVDCAMLMGGGRMERICRCVRFLYHCVGGIATLTIARDASPLASTWTPAALQGG